MSETEGASSAARRARALIHRSVQLRCVSAGERLGCTHAAESRLPRPRGRRRARETPCTPPGVHAPVRAHAHGGQCRPPPELSSPSCAASTQVSERVKRVGCPVERGGTAARTMTPQRAAGTRLKAGCSPRSGEGGGQGRRPSRPATAQAEPQRGRRARPRRPASVAQGECRPGVTRRIPENPDISTR